MPVVTVKLPRGVTSLSAEMTSMRSWLDAHRCAPSKFECDLLPDTVVMQIEFNSAQEAEAFNRRFEAGVVGGKSARPRQTMEQVCWWRLTAEEIRAEADGFTSSSARETMSQIALSYDRMAEDLEKRLGESRYRLGLVVS